MTGYAIKIRISVLPHVVLGADSATGEKYEKSVTKKAKLNITSANLSESPFKHLWQRAFLRASRALFVLECLGAPGFAQEGFEHIHLLD